MQDMLWIENIVESTLAPPFLTNSRVDMANFVDPCKVVVGRNAFSFYSSAQNEGELEGEAQKKLRIRMPIFTSERRFEFIREP